MSSRWLPSTGGNIRVMMTQFCYFLAIWLLFCGMVAWGIGAGKHVETPELRMPVHEPDIAEMIVLASVEAGLPSHIGITQGWIESRFTNAFSEHGEIGPLQIKAVVAMARGHDLVALLDPQNSIRVGVAWLKEWSNKCGVARASRAYMRGRCR